MRYTRCGDLKYPALDTEFPMVGNFHTPGLVILISAPFPVLEK